MTFVRLLFFITVTFAIGNELPNCSVSFRFSKICHIYKFDKVCQPWDLAKCNKVKTLKNHFKCPTYSCAHPQVSKGPTDFIVTKESSTSGV